MINEIAIVDEKSIRDKIHIIRGREVIFDSDLAEIYGYTTKRLNEQVQRNINKFDSDFMFKISEDEFQYLKSQNAASSWGEKENFHMLLRSKVSIC